MKTLPLFAAVLICASGCATLNSPFEASGLPDRRYLVGGGFLIEYLSPGDGTALWVEETTGKVLATKSVTGTGSEIEFEADSPSDLERVVGIPLKEMKLGLYFIPEASVEE